MIKKTKYVLYKDNPDLPQAIVETVSGEKEYRRNCRYISNKYYVINKDVFFIEEKNLWYRTCNDKIEQDYETGEWFLKGTRKLTYGIVGFSSTGDPIIGGFTSNPYNNCQARTPSGSKQIALNPEILLANNYIEDIANCEFFCKKGYSLSDIKELTKIRQKKNYTNKGYTVEENKGEFEDKKKLFAGYNTKINKDAKKFGKYLGDLTVGCELECSQGTLMDYKQNRLGLLVVRDGSLDNGSGIVGPEWVTVPMQGSKCLQNLINVGLELQKSNTIDINCSYHIHCGNLPKERIFLVALYMLSYSIQDEVFKMWPYYKTDHVGVKRKNYCQKLKKMSIYSLKDFSQEGYDQYVDTVYNKIFTFLSDGQEASSDTNRTQGHHPRSRKWEISSRYVWQNLVNMLFSKNVTAEQRLSSPTLNPQRLVNWLFMQVGILRYCENNMKKIISGERISFIDVLNFYKDHYPGDRDAAFLSSYLIEYYNVRVEQFRKDIEKGDKISSWEIDNDKSYKFTFEKQSLFCE